jgi:EAL domain-containing protein (putative c-di-GMP-specific phosphodiesterase class I)
MAKYDVPAERVCIEVTEGMFLGSKATQVIDGLHALFGMGVEVAFDDYGTGFASLMHLRMPINRIKIDRMFARGIETDKTNQAIVKSIIGLAADLGKRVTVEGVETASQQAALMELGCTSQQGFGLAMPMPAEDLMTFAKIAKRHGLAQSAPACSA